MSASERIRTARQLLETVPVREYIEVPGKPDVIYEIRDYSQDPENGAELARSDLPFLFKPFEVGQKPPPTKGQKPPFGREPTIHEYLDWTVTAATNLDSLDFSGFRILTLLPRYRPSWPPPETDGYAGVKVRSNLGAPLNPVPVLSPFGSKPISAATIRSGNGYIEVPFFATKPSARGKGYGKALLYAIEDICRFLDVDKIMLCSTDDPPTISTWQHLGFRHTQPNELAEWGILPSDLLHMTNTVQMVKLVHERPKWKSVLLRHQGFEQRVYFIQKKKNNNANSIEAKRAHSLSTQLRKKRRKEEMNGDTASPSKLSRVEEEVSETQEAEVVDHPKNGIIQTEILPSLWSSPHRSEKKAKSEQSTAQEQQLSTETPHPSQSSKKENPVLGLSSEFG